MNTKRGGEWTTVIAAETNTDMKIETKTKTRIMMEMGTEWGRRRE